MEPGLRDAQANVRKSIEMKGPNPTVSWSSSVPIKQVPKARRNNKPLMEKRRRARINQSVALLKNILLASRPNMISEKPQKQAKLEKADILEMTVRHFQMTQALFRNGADKYRCGFHDCIKEIVRYCNIPSVSTDGLPGSGEDHILVKVLTHLELCLAEIESKATSDDELLYSQDDELLHSQDDELLYSPDDERAPPCELTPAQIKHINMVEDRRLLDMMLSMNGNRHRREELEMQSEESEIGFGMDMDDGAVKQERCENTLSQESFHQDGDISDSSQKLPKPVFKAKSFEDNTMLSMMPSVTVPGQVVFLVPANVFGINTINNTPHFLTPFLQKTSQAEKAFTEMEVHDQNGQIKKKFDEQESLSSDKKSDEEFFDNDFRESLNDCRDKNKIEPLDFSVNSDMPQNDPMWRPW